MDGWPYYDMNSSIKNRKETKKLQNYIRTDSLLYMKKSRKRTEVNNRSLLGERRSEQSIGVTNSVYDRQGVMLFFNDRMK